MFPFLQFGRVIFPQVLHTTYYIGICSTEHRWFTCRMLRRSGDFNTTTIYMMFYILIRAQSGAFTPTFRAQSGTFRPLWSGVQLLPSFLDLLFVPVRINTPSIGIFERAAFSFAVRSAVVGFLFAFGFVEVAPLLLYFLFAILDIRGSILLFP